MYILISANNFLSVSWSIVMSGSVVLSEVAGFKFVVVSDISVSHNVIATGGSVIYSDKAMATLKRDGIVIYLYLPFEEVILRINNIKTRGIVIRNGSTLQNVYDERVPLYEKYSDSVKLRKSFFDTRKTVGDVEELLRKS